MPAPLRIIRENKNPLDERHRLCHMLFQVRDYIAWSNERLLCRLMPVGSTRRLGQAHSRRGCAREYAVNFGGHDEIVLMQSLDLLGLQRDCGIAPAEADIRMMAFSLREFTNFLNKGERLPEVAKSEAPLDPVSFIQ
jgi:hypothetical protein